jgi:hypothetical protein
MWEGPQGPDFPMLMLVIVIVLASRGAEAAPTLFHDGAELALLLNEFRHQAGPSGLM